jgi:hypothetical protein
MKFAQRASIFISKQPERCGGLVSLSTASLKRLDLLEGRATEPQSLSPRHKRSATMPVRSGICLKTILPTMKRCKPIQRAWIPCWIAARTSNHPVRQLCGTARVGVSGSRSVCLPRWHNHHCDFPGSGLLAHWLGWLRDRD